MHTTHGGNYSFVIPVPPGTVVGGTAAEVDERDMAASQELERMIPADLWANNDTFKDVVIPRTALLPLAAPAPSRSLVLFEDLISCTAQADDVCAVVLNKAEVALAATARSSNGASTAGSDHGDHHGDHNHGDPWQDPLTVVVVLLSAVLLVGIGIAIVRRRPATSTDRGPAADTASKEGSLEVFEFEGPTTGRYRSMPSVTSI
jgi:hypothetical protein